MTSAKLKYSGTRKRFVPLITASAIGEVALQASVGKNSQVNLCISKVGGAMVEVQLAATDGNAVL